MFVADLPNLFRAFPWRHTRRDGFVKNAPFMCVDIVGQWQKQSSSSSLYLPIRIKFHDSLQG